jgi:hypothetical protein
MHKRVGVMDSDTWKYEQLLKILFLYRLMEKRKRQLRTEGLNFERKGKGEKLCWGLVFQKSLWKYRGRIVKAKELIG